MDHIFLPENSEITEPYRPRRGGGGIELPERNRASHSAMLDRNWKAVWAQYDARQQEACCIGQYLDFRSSEGFSVSAVGLEDSRAGISISNVKNEVHEDVPVPARQITVFVPSDQRKIFQRKIADYAEKETKIRHEPRHKLLIESIEEIRQSTVQSLWSDSIDLMPQPGGISTWCEVWLTEPDGPLLTDPQSGSPLSVIQFRTICDDLGIEVKPKTLRFPGRIICLILATYEQLTAVMGRCGMIGELRGAKETAEFFMDLPNDEQVAWERDLLNRLDLGSDGGVSICVLDTGANSGHPLLSPVLAEQHCLVADDRWLGTDRDGHGTGMCGLAAYGDLVEALDSDSPVIIRHRLESVKILPDRGENKRELWGEITKEGMHRAENTDLDRQHIGCLAITTPDGRDSGKPSSWSAAIDQLTSGAEDGKRRLMFVSAGNVDAESDRDYPNANVNFSVCDPGQAWNAVTVGAYTNKCRLLRQSMEGCTTVAEPDQLSPFSPTSVLWNVKKWPLKPDILMEGGNLVKFANGEVSPEDGVCLLTTDKNPASRQFQWFNGTSAATALSARMAAQIAARYPNAWPETIRALMIHSAKWPLPLLAQYKSIVGHSALSKAEFVRLVRFAGYGVPDVNRALDCASNALTLIAQAELQPFKKGAGAYAIANEIDFYKLPWPRQALLDLGERPVTIRVTLSYFVEPSPGEIGWNDRYRYPSHMLRFDLNTPEEDLSSFKRRLNKLAQLEEEGGELDESLDGGSERWTIGKNGRQFGSIHSDFFTKPAAELATCNLVGVVPVGGWWKTRPKFERYTRKAKYALIVSLETDITDVDIYTPVYNEVNIRIATPIVQ